MIVLPALSPKKIYAACMFELFVRSWGMKGRFALPRRRLRKAARRAASLLLSAFVRRSKSLGGRTVKGLRRFRRICEPQTDAGTPNSYPMAARPSRLATSNVRFRRAPLAARPLQAIVGRHWLQGLL